MDTETLYTVREAAERISVTQSAIRNATLQGRLPFVVKFGRKLIEHDALAAYQARTQPGGVKAPGRPYKIEKVIPGQPSERSAATGAVSHAGTDSENSDGQ